MDIVPWPGQKRCHACTMHRDSWRPREQWRPAGVPQRPAAHHERIAELRAAGRSWRQIAQAIGAHEGAVKSYWNRIKRQERKA